jgi:hypothetical protein
MRRGSAKREDALSPIFREGQHARSEHAAPRAGGRASLRFRRALRDRLTRFQIGYRLLIRRWRLLAETGDCRDDILLHAYRLDDNMIRYGVPVNPCDQRANPRASWDHVAQAIMLSPRLKEPLVAKFFTLLPWLSSTVALSLTPLTNMMHLSLLPKSPRNRGVQQPSD